MGRVLVQIGKVLLGLFALALKYTTIMLLLIAILQLAATLIGLHLTMRQDIGIATLLIGYRWYHRWVLSTHVESKE